MQNKKELVFCVYVFGEYSKYIPYYIYGVLSIYPEHYVKVFLDKSLSKEEKQCLLYIDSNNYEIIENFNLAKDKNCFLNSKKNQKILRWLIPYKEFSDFKYVYFGDVDILIKREPESLLKSHTNHINKIRLPFSNAIRKNFNRLTGLHFIDVEEYFKITNDFILDFLEKPDVLVIEKMEQDEDFLYYLVDSCMDLKKDEHIIGEKYRGIKNNHFYRPHHGVHLGLLRTSKEGRLKKWKEKHKYFIKNTPNYIYDENFNKMLEIIPLDEILFLRDKLKSIIIRHGNKKTKS